MEYLKCNVCNNEPGEKRKFMNRSTYKVITESCIVFSCENGEERFNSSSLLKCEKIHPHCHCTHCQRTQAALRCYAKAQPLSLKLFYSIIFKRNETKQEIWLPDIKSFGPSVQCASKNIVKY
ncbi:hypothetical protein HZU73_08791 [Apis mellifera caucasica]|uniref:Uncharacterized protein LOC727119 n=1 Tax=Apis mellifera TaxID=7460 RepID=A0A7M7H5T2_APIME|nr:uncharacterized protein LOC727119 [Apis mellifera]KAG6795898.1 hypothetical protein HZU73_08791 [Apis mellifera caucasica]KAG9427771.1 hypothetical protein HZU67_10561 [Apis mellifera carnica]|eukprot:XP_006572345.1 uncharacterized protein LOC727119 [Apis mellifera]